MRKSRIPLDWLATFEAAARHMSFTNAARELGLTQAAVSIQIARLEEALGQTLFIRKGRSLHLTQRAHSFVPRVSSTLAQLQHSTDLLFQTAHSDYVLIYCLSNMFIVNCIAPMMPRMMLAFPEAEFEIAAATPHTEPPSGQNCIYISYRSRGELGDRYIPLLEENLLAVASPRLKQDNWHKAPLIMHTGLRGALSLDLERLGLERMKENRRLVVGSMQYAVACAENDAGVAIVSLPAATRVLESGRLVALNPSKTVAAAQFTIDGQRLGDASALTHQVSEWMLKYFQQSSVGRML